VPLLTTATTSARLSSLAIGQRMAEAMQAARLPHVDEP
jgi:hypothetical protein